MTALLAESEGLGDEVDAEERENHPLEGEEDFDSLFDGASEEDEYKESAEEDGQRTGAGDDVSDLFGDVDDLEIEEGAKRNGGGEERKALNKSREDLQGLFLYFLPDVQFWSTCPNVQVHINVSSSEELRRMQEQMQRLQQQLEASQQVSNASSGSGATPERSAGPKPVLPPQGRAKPTAAPQKMATQAGTGTHFHTLPEEAGSCLCKNVLSSNVFCPSSQSSRQRVLRFPR